MGEKRVASLDRLFAVIRRKHWNGLRQGEERDAGADAIRAMSPGDRPPGGVRFTGPVLVRLALVGAVLMLCEPRSVATGPVRIITSHGYTPYGQLKYPADFRHFDYVNPDAPKGGSYRTAQGNSFDTLNSFVIRGAPPPLVRVIHDQLMVRALDEPASQYGLIAETIRYPENFAWTEFQLRPQARWHDGRPITPEDVIFTVEKMAADGAPAFRRTAASVAKAQKTGPRSVRLTFKTVGNPNLPALIGEMPILPKHYWQGRDFSATTMEPPLSSGPYRITGLVASRSVTVGRVKDYWARDLPVNRGRYNFDEIRQDFYRDQWAMNEAIIAGQYDLRQQASRFRRSGVPLSPPQLRGEIVTDSIPYQSGALLQGMMINSRQPRFADVRVREAVSRAFNFDYVHRTMLDGLNERLTSYFPNLEFASKGVPTGAELELLNRYRAQLPERLFTEPFTLAGHKDRVESRQSLLRAAELLEEAGWTVRDGRLVSRRTGEIFTLEVILTSPTYDRVLAPFVDNLRRLGVATKVRVIDLAQFLLRMNAHDFDLAISPPRAPQSLVPGEELRNFWGSASAGLKSTQNYTGVSNPVVDGLIDDILAASDRDRVVSGMRALDRVLLWGHYSIPFYHLYPSPLGQIPVDYWDRFGRPEVTPPYGFTLFTLDTWWIDPVRDARLRQSGALMR